MTSNGRWKARLAKSLGALRPAYGSGTMIYRTTIAKKTLAQLQATIPFGGGSRGLQIPPTPFFKGGKQGRRCRLLPPLKKGD